MNSSVSLSVVMPFLASVFTGSGCCYWRLGYWDGLEEERLKEETLLIPWGWGQRRKGEAGLGD